MLAALAVGCGAPPDPPAAREVPPAAGGSVVPTTTTAVSAPVPSLAAGGEAAVVVHPAGVALPVLETLADGRWRVRTPCSREAVVADGQPVTAAHVVLDAGHGGDEPGAVGPSGLVEADVNLDVTRRAAHLLRRAGYVVVETRTTDVRVTLATRAEVATRLGAGAFVSVHHNADPDGPWPRPGSETYFQIADPASRRLAGLVWEEVVAALEVYEADWVADTDAGAKYRPSSDGGDYYGVLRRTAGVPAVLVEAAFITNPTEEALLADPAVRAAEAGAIARAVGRFFTTDDPGSGFTEPYPRTQPAGPGGGAAGCTDPPLS